MYEISFDSQIHGDYEVLLVQTLSLRTRCKHHQTGAISIALVNAPFVMDEPSTDLDYVQCNGKTMLIFVE